MSVAAPEPVNDEAGSGDPPASGRGQPRFYGDRRTEEAEGGLLGGEQQVQVRRVR